MSLPGDKEKIVLMILDVNIVRPQPPHYSQFWGKLDEHVWFNHSFLFMSDPLCKLQNVHSFQHYT